MLSAYAAALAAVNGTAAVERALIEQPKPGQPVCVLAIGKAAVAMAEGARSILGGQIKSGLIITKAGCAAARMPERWTCIEAGHPVPDERSLAAGDRLLAFLRVLPVDCELLVLISGGASSLAEVLAPGWTLERLQDLNRWLLASGWSIHQINAVRRRASLIKGGKLRYHLDGRRARVLAISDVRGDDPSIIGSGLLVAPQHIHLPSPLSREFESDLLPNDDTVAPGERAADVSYEIVANNLSARAAAAADLRSKGYSVTLHEDEQYGDAVETGRRLAAQVINGAEGVHIWGGETTVVLPSNPGRGGRCQSLALAAADVFQGRDGVGLLAAGTDGSDGPGDDAGAVVDGKTISAGALEGLDAKAALARADSGSFLAAAQALINTGPTGTNVMDLIIGWRL